MVGSPPTLKKDDLVIYQGDVCLVIRVTECSAVIQRTGSGKDRREIHISASSEVAHV